MKQYINYLLTVSHSLIRIFYSQSHANVVVRTPQAHGMARKNAQRPFIPEGNVFPSNQAKEIVDLGIRTGYSTSSRCRAYGTVLYRRYQTLTKVTGLSGMDGTRVKSPGIHETVPSTEHNLGTVCVVVSGMVEFDVVNKLT